MEVRSKRWKAERKELEVLLEQAEGHSYSCMATWRSFKTRSSFSVRNFAATKRQKLGMNFP